MTKERFIFAGQITDKGKKIKHNKGKVLLNVMVAATQEVYGGIKDEVEKRIILFQSQADKGFKEISRGDYVLFSACKRSPREYTTTKGTHVEDVDIIADRFTVLTPAQFEANSEAFDKDMPTLSELEFNSDDRKALEDKKTKIKTLAAQAAKAKAATAGAVI